MKIIAFYLPQYHAIPENDEWWGKDFTEWNNVKRGQPLFDGHYQPKTPQNNNYYNLLDDEVKKWQIELAKKNGIYGFCFYHYWFNGHLLLEKPIEQYLDNKDLDFPFCICWANPPWTKAWVSRSDKILIDQDYGSKEQWKAHFEYLLPFIKDSRYITNDGKPLLVIFDPTHINCLEDMLAYWRKLAIEHGMPGIDFAYQYVVHDNSDEKYREVFDYDIEFQPAYALQDSVSKTKKKVERVLRVIDNSFYELTGRKLSEFIIKRVRKHDYDEIWSTALNRKPKDEKSVPGVFVDWDNTPRRGEGGRVFIGGTPEKFQKYMSAQIKKTRDEYKKDFMFLTAWNEWSEGCYLEPDEKFHDGYLKAIKEALIAIDEFPQYPDFKEILE